MPHLQTCTAAYAGHSQVPEGLLLPPIQQRLAADYGYVPRLLGDSRSGFNLIYRLRYLHLRSGNGSFAQKGQISSQ